MTEYSEDLGIIRPVRPNKDILPVADLIELCFAQQMDSDGIDYLRHIRKVASQPAAMRWLPGSNERVSYPLFGYVYVIGERIIGNCSLIPYYRQQQWRYLIANVAVHPDFRQRGIGRQLTLKAMEHIRAHGAVPWLQVRSDNPVALQLYLDLGFHEVVRRDTWQLNPTTNANLQKLDGWTISPRQKDDWIYQENWLRATYPPQVAWNVPFHLSNFQPHWYDPLRSFFYDVQIEHWSARSNDRLAGVVSWERSTGNSDWLWIAADTDSEQQVIRSIIPHMQERHIGRILIVNHPADRATAAFQACGFEFINCLIWMTADENRRG